MDIETNRTNDAYKDAASAQYRSKPFLTILDGKPSVSRKTRPVRRSGLPAAASLFRKSGTKLQSFAGDKAQVVADGLKKGMGAAARTLEAIPEAIADAAGKDSLPKPDRKGKAGVAKSFPSISIKSLKSVASRIAAAASSVDMKSIRAPRIIISAIIAAIAISAVTAAIIGATSFPLSPGALLLPDEDSAQTALMAYLEPDSAGKEELPSGALPPIPVSVNIKPYTIRSGDSLEKIAKRFGLRQDTIISANNLQSATAIRPGIQLRIPNMDGVSHKVRSGESLSSLAKAYSIDMTRIVDANDLASGTISKGQSLFIPNARLSSASLREFYGERFVWPARGRISSPFGYRANPFTGLRTYHSAIDIVMSPGTRVKATSEGRVADTGYNSVFGNYIILKHASGYQSLYAHLSSISVKEGSSVAQGAAIGLSGNTGQSTGPHLHFSIFKNGQALDPAKYVK